MAIGRHPLAEEINAVRWDFSKHRVRAVGRETERSIGTNRDGLLAHCAQEGLRGTLTERDIGALTEKGEPEQVRVSVYYHFFSIAFITITKPTKRLHHCSIPQKTLPYPSISSTNPSYTVLYYYSTIPLYTPILPAIPSISQLPHHIPHNLYTTSLITLSLPIPPTTPMTATFTPSLDIPHTISI